MQPRQHSQRRQTNSQSCDRIPLLPDTLRHSHCSSELLTGVCLGQVGSELLDRANLARTGSVPITNVFFRGKGRVARSQSRSESGQGSTFIREASAGKWLLA